MTGQGPLSKPRHNTAVHKFVSYDSRPQTAAAALLLLRISAACGELRRIKDWADDNHLKLNATKSRQIIFQARGKCNKIVQLPLPCMGIEQVTQITALDVVINDHMTATDHVTGSQHC